MKIEWVPWDEPLHRRVQTVVAFIQMQTLLFGELICLFIFVLALFKGHFFIKILCIIYLIIIYIQRDTGNTGGRGAGHQWVRNWTVWRYFADYFPVDLVKTAELRPDRHYLFALYPHGVLSSGAFSNFNTNASKWKQLFPGVRSKLMSLNFHFHLPFFRELMFGWGMGCVSPNSINTLLNAPTDPGHPKNADGFTSNGVMIVVGGAQEAIFARPDNYTIVLKNRKGFVKLALMNGVPLVPVLSFGEVDVFDQLPNPPGSLMRRYQEFLKRTTGISPIFFIGRGIFQTTYGWAPRSRPITTVVGAPIEFTKNTNPTIDDIDDLHKIFCTEIYQLFETHKSKYIKNHKNVFLNIQ